MTTTAERLRTYWGARQIDRARLTALAVRYWEVALYGGLIGLALGLRLWDLGGRAVHHDESLHMYYAWQLFKGNGYEHIPFMHGPFQFYGSAAIFRLFGDSDFTARLLYSLVGSALVGAPFFLRNYLGRSGAIIAAGLLAISPSLLYFSRFARGDIYTVAFMLGLVVVMWRYLKEQKETYLYFVPVFLVLSFLTIELTFIVVAAFLVYLEVQLANDFVDQLRASRKMRPAEVALAYAVLLPTAWLIASLWPLIAEARKRWSLSVLPPAGHLMVLLGTLAVVQFGPAVEKLPFIGDDGFYQEVAGGENGLFWSTTLVLLLASALVGLMWNPRVWLASAAIFYVPFVLLYTTGFTAMDGFKSGIWGSLDYWLGQQFVRRGNQPDYYYFMMMPVYEFLPLVFALGGALYYAFRGNLERRLLSGAALLLVLLLSIMPHGFVLIGKFHIQAAFVVAIVAVLLLSMDSFTKFLLFWTLSVLFALTVAGEKMPWLTVHIALPLALLGAKVLDDVLSSAGAMGKAPAVGAPPARAAIARAKKGGTPEEEPAGFSLGGVMPLVYGGALALAAAGIFQAVGPASVISIVPWLLAVAAAALVARVAATTSWRAAGQVAAVALFGALLVFTLRAGGMAAFDQGNPDGYPQEMLIYAQGSPKLGLLNDEIERVARASGKGRDLKVIIDGSGNIWPWPWYMRNRGYEQNNFDADFVPPAGSVVLISVANQAKMEPYKDQYHEPIPYTHMWWFPELYRGLETDDFLADFFRGRFLSTWRGYFIDRTVPGATNTPDMLAYFPKSFEEPSVPTTTPPVQASADTLPADSVTIIGGPGSGPKQFAQPADLYVDQDGNLFVVDTLNHRIQKIAPNGDTETLGEEGTREGEFGNPQLQDEQFAADGPWGIGVDGQGNIYVADTWNHRLQKFDSALQFVQEWGTGELFGPRDVGFDAAGNLLLVDTGNKHVLTYTTDGELIESHGKDGDGPGEFKEPSSVSVAANGDIYVADFWNKRIQVFDPQFRYRTEISVPSWGSSGITDRAYIVALDDGHVLATDPANGRIIVFDSSGEQRAAWKLPSFVGASRPVGIAIDGQQQVYISDGLTSQVVRVPLAALLAPSPPP